MGGGGGSTVELWECPVEEQRQGFKVILTKGVSVCERVETLLF